MEERNFIKCEVCEQVSSGNKCINLDCRIGKKNAIINAEINGLKKLRGKKNADGRIRLHTDKILEAMAQTFKEKNTKYKDNYLAVGQILSILFPEGITLITEEDFIQHHFIDWMIGKLTRFAKTDCQDADSIHDMAVYAAMIEDYITQRKDKR